MNTIEFNFGHENQRGASWKVQTFIVDGEGQEHFATQATQRIEGFNVIGKHGSPAVDDQRTDVGGWWTTLNAQVPDGTLFKMFVSRHRLGSLPCVCATLYRVRSNAPLIRAAVQGINLQHSTRSSVVAFFGRADRVPLEEAKAIGYKSKPAYEKFFDSVDEDSLIEVDTQAEGIAKPPVTVEETIDPETGEKSYQVRKVELRRIRKRSPR